MPSPPKSARIAAVASIAPGVVELRCRALEPLGHAAGNYVILRTDLPNPDKPGQVLKRAYSIATAPDSGDDFALRVEVVGPVSRWLAAREVGEVLTFSGPWGKRFRLFEGDAAPLHLFATGTGLSPIGALAEAWRASGAPGPVTVRWQTGAPYGEAALAALRDDPRFDVAVGTDLEAAVPADPTALYMLAGDGAAIARICARLQAAGVPAAQIRTEPFFNKPAA